MGGEWRGGASCVPRGAFPSFPVVPPSCVLVILLCVQSWVVARGMEQEWASGGNCSEEHGAGGSEQGKIVAKWGENVCFFSKKRGILLGLNEKDC